MVLGSLQDPEQDDFWHEDEEPKVIHLNDLDPQSPSVVRYDRVVSMLGALHAEITKVAEALEDFRGEVAGFLYKQPKRQKVKGLTVDGRIRGKLKAKADKAAKKGRKKRVNKDG